MKLTSTKLPEVVIIEPAVFSDERGWFMESFNQQAFSEGILQKGLPMPPLFVQDNHSVSQRGVLRGLHYQLTPNAQGKLVRVTQGAVFDVAVDIRPHSPTFGHWVGIELSASNFLQLWIPPGFAHGFIALENNTHFLYKTTNYYCKASEACIVWNDPVIGIKWPEMSAPPVLSAKDQLAPLLKDALLA